MENKDSRTIKIFFAVIFVMAAAVLICLAVLFQGCLRDLNSN